MTWSAEEDEALIFWQGSLGNKWVKVAQHIPGRTGQQCAQRWRHKGNPEIRKAKWTVEEDATLVDLVTQHGNAWALIARQIPGRTDQQCMGRWRRHLDPNINFGIWKPWEDQHLRKLFDELGNQWSKIGQAFGNRTAQQCRARWVQIHTEGGEKPILKRVKRSGSIESSPSASSKRARNQDCTEDDENDFPVEYYQKCAAIPASARRKVAGNGIPQNGGFRHKQGSLRGDFSIPSPKLPSEIHVPRRSRRYPGRPLQQKQAVFNSTPASLQPPLPKGYKASHRSSGPRHAADLSAAGKASVMTQGHIKQTADRQRTSTEVYVDALFFWLQLLLLRPLQPVTAGLDGSLAVRMRHLAALSTATFLLYCCPRIRFQRRSNRVKFL